MKNSANSDPRSRCSLGLSDPFCQGIRSFTPGAHQSALPVILCVAALLASGSPAIPAPQPGRQEVLVRSVGGEGPYRYLTKRTLSDVPLCRFAKKRGVTWNLRHTKQMERRDGG